MTQPTFIFLATIHREEPIPGIKKVHLGLIRDDDVVEIVEGQEFVTVTMVMDPFEEGK